MQRWFGNPGRGGRYLLYSLGVHVVAGALLFVNLGPMSVQVQQTEPPEIIHAVTVDQEEIESRLDAQREAIAQAQREEERRRQEEEARRQAEEERRQQREAEQERQRQQEAERQRREEEQRRAEEQRRREEAERQRREEEQRRAEEERRQQEEAERQRREEEERRRQEEEQRRAEEEQRRQEEERRRAEEERRRQEEQQRRREEEMRQRMEEEAAQRAQARAVNVWAGLVRDAWVRPPGSAAGLSAVVRVRLLPTGQVISIEIVESSGDDAFDRSVRNAIERVSPLPVPDDASAFRRAGLDNVAFRFMPDG